MAELASYWRLGPAVTACLAASRILFLDATRDRYLALPAEQTGAFSAWLDAPENGLADACRSSLSALAVGTDVIPRPERHQIELPAPFDARLLAPCRPDPGDIMAIGREVFRAWRDVRRLPLAAIVERRRHELAWRSPAGNSLETRLALFRSVRPLIPVPRVCLHDCLALLRWIEPAAPDSALVIGVSATPFAAHCWLQAGGQVIDDHPESPSRFSPILHVQ